MKAICWHATHDVRVEDVPDPGLVNPRDAVIRITLSAICGSDLHLYDGYVPTMKDGDILGHEFMGEVVEVGAGVANLRKGDRVVVPFPIACGRCRYCKEQKYALCDNSNPNAWMAEKMYGFAPAGIYGYSHLMGGYAGGQAEYVRVPYADVGPIKVPDHLSDEQVLFLSDVLPTGWQAALYCEIKPTDVVAIWGAGPVGLLAAESARVLGAARILVIDRFPERLELARSRGAETINYEETDFLEALKNMTGGRGPDACIDAVGSEGHAPGIAGLYDKAKQAMRLETDRPIALREAIQACAKGGIVSIPGVYAGFLDKVNMGAAFNKGLTFRMGQTHVQKYLPDLLGRIERGEIDATFIISHRLSLEEAPYGYEMFRKKEERCTKIVLKPATVH
jgi:threonine dehydrogenase-like Zn-dependent dehydrogenase